MFKFLKYNIVLSIFLFSLLTIAPLFAQGRTASTSDVKSADAAKNKVANAAQKGFPLSNVSSTDVTNNISVEATLIPASIAKTVFGKEVSNNYAVIALTISNRSSDYAFIVHTIFMDYSQWLLGGSSPFTQNQLCPNAAQSSSSTANAGEGKRSPNTVAAEEGTSAGAVMNANSTQQETVETEKSTQPRSSIGSAAGNGSVPESSAQNSAKDQSSAGQSSSSQICRGNPLQPWQQQTLPNQINSVETRIVREELLARQPWTTRNWVIRSLVAAGSIATSFTFVTSSQSWIRGIGAFNGAGVPAAENLWPDSTIGQMNEISDVGFQVNKAIAKESSDIIVAFFPIDRFLTPSLKSLFISSPAAFFSPMEAFVDPKTRPQLEVYLASLFPASDTVTQDDINKKTQSSVTNLFKYLTQIENGNCSSSTTKKAMENAFPIGSDLASACVLAEMVDRMSLNTVRVIIGGTMTVDVNNVPPQIKNVEIDPPAGKTNTSMWTLKSGEKSATLNGTIDGSFLSGGTPTLVNAPEGITIKGVSEGSSDTELKFTLTLTSTLPATTKQLTFDVSKSSASGSTLKSATKDYPIPQTSQASTPATSTEPGASGKVAVPEKAPAPPKPEPPK